MAAHVEQGPAGSADPPDPPDPADPSVGELVRQATTHLSALIRGEIDLAKLELAASIRRFGWGAVFFGAAAVVVCFSLLFPFVALAEGLVAVGLPRWGAYLVVWGVLLLLAGLLGYLGVRMVKRIRKPQRTLETVRDSARLVRHPTGHPTGDPNRDPAGGRRGADQRAEPAQPAGDSDPGSGDRAVTP